MASTLRREFLEKVVASTGLVVGTAETLLASARPEPIVTASPGLDPPPGSSTWQLLIRSMRSLPRSP